MLFVFSDRAESIPLKGGVEEEKEEELRARSVVLAAGKD